MEEPKRGREKRGVEEEQKKKKKNSFEVFLESLPTFFFMFI